MQRDLVVICQSTDNHELDLHYGILSTDPIAAGAGLRKRRLRGFCRQGGTPAIQRDAAASPKSAAFGANMVAALPLSKTRIITEFHAKS